VLNIRNKLEWEDNFLSIFENYQNFTPKLFYPLLSSCTRTIFHDLLTNLFKHSKAPLSKPVDWHMQESEMVLPSPSYAVCVEILMQSETNNNKNPEQNH
jgi:hypothetical protein